MRIQKVFYVLKLASTWVSALMLMLIIRHAYLFFKSTKNNARPFKADNIIKLKKAGIGMIVYAFVEVIARKGFYASFADSAPASQVPDPALLSLPCCFCNRFNI